MKRNWSEALVEPEGLLLSADVPASRKKAYVGDPTVQFSTINRYSAIRKTRNDVSFSPSYHLRFGT